MVGVAESLVGVKMFPSGGGLICYSERGGKSVLEGLGRVGVIESKHGWIDGWWGRKRTFVGVKEDWDGSWTKTTKVIDSEGDKDRVVGGDGGNDGMTGGVVGFSAVQFRAHAEQVGPSYFW